jgi:hypothetical protein
LPQFFVTVTYWTELHRAWIRERVGVVRDIKQARNLAEQATYDAMQTEGNPAGRRLGLPSKEET